MGRLSRPGRRSPVARRPDPPYKQGMPRWPAWMPTAGRGRWTLLVAGATVVVVLVAAVAAVSARGRQVPGAGGMLTTFQGVAGAVAGTDARPAQDSGSAVPAQGAPAPGS